MINFRNETGYTKASPPISLAEIKDLANDKQDGLDAETDLSNAKEEFKDEFATSPMSAEEDDVEDEGGDEVGAMVKEEPSKEPPPPGGDLGEETRNPTPTVDEKPTEEMLAATAAAAAAATEADASSATVGSTQSGPASTTAASNLAILAQKAPLLALQQALLQGSPLLLGTQNIQQLALIQQGLMAMQRMPQTSSSAPLLPTPTGGPQTSSAAASATQTSSGQIQPLMSAQPPTHIPPPGFPRTLPPPPRFQGPPSVPPPGSRPMRPPGPRPMPQSNYSAPMYPPNGIPSSYGNQASNAANALASHPILQQG